MRKTAFFLSALLVSSCGQPGQQQSRDKPQPVMMAAIQSVSLEFPLQFGPGDNPPGYTKVVTGQGRSTDPTQLISALVLCSPDVAWIEKTSHSAAIIMPSERSVIWRGSTTWHPTNRDIIACIKESAGQPFFYRELPRGIETFQQ